MAGKPSVFISYSHVDESWKDKLAVHLGVLAKQNRLYPWEDRRIAAGDDWFGEIEQAIDTAQVAVLLVSADFLNSNFIHREEIPRLLASRESKGLRIIPILVRPCPWKKVDWLAKMQMRPVDGREIAAGNDYQVDKDFASIAEEIDGLLVISVASSATEVALTASAKFDLSALPPTGAYFFGREDELAELDRAWTTSSTNIISLVAWGGAGKSALVNRWLGNMATADFRGADRAYGWSFYSQGTKETETSADEFFKAALTWFGDSEPERGSPWQKGERLAGLIQKQRTLLVLDGMEPLQNPPGVEGGKLKDPALAELLRHLEVHNPGLCLITTRLEVADIADRRHATAPVIDLGRLSTAAGSDLLEAIGARGEPEELAEAVDAVDGHALTLNLLGTYVRDILDRDVRRWREAGLLESARHGNQRALQVMAAYETWFAGRPELAILRILGLFDRPARRELVDVLRKPPVIAGLNNELVNLSENEWRWALARLRQARLIEDEAGGAIDAHPLVREHFGARLKTERPEAWRAGHGRLYEHLRNSAKRYPETLSEMAPLFQAMHHGCQAGRHQEALEKVYEYWIRRKDREGFVVTGKLGAFGADLEALAGVFASRWTQPVPTLTKEDQARVLGNVAYDLRALGRLQEAVEPRKSALSRWLSQGNWKEAASSAGLLSQLLLILGDIEEAIVQAESSVKYADCGGDDYERMAQRTKLADALHQAGNVAKARSLLEEAEALQAQREPERKLLYNVFGFRYRSLLFDLGCILEVRERVQKTWEWDKDWLQDLALNYVSFGQAALAGGDHDYAKKELNCAVAGLRSSGRIDHLPRGLLARAALFRQTSDFPASRRDLDEAMRIARRSEMRLFRCDAHLEYARLALAEEKNDQAHGHVVEARRLVDETGYGRRRPEVEALEAEVRWRAGV